MGVVGIIAFSSFPMHMFDSGFQLTSILFPMIPVVFGIVLVIVGALPGKSFESIFQVPQPVVVKETVRVKVRCQYCGGLYDETLDKCPNCGARK